MSDNLSNTIRFARRQQSKTLRDIAAETGLSASFLSDIERGRTRPSLASCKAIMKCLGIDIMPYTEQPLTATESDLLAAWNAKDFKKILRMISDVM